MPRKAAFISRRHFNPTVELLETRELLNATPAQLVTRLYTDLLNRQPDPAGLSFWSNQLAGGRSATSVASSLLATSEALGNLVDGRFQLILGRQAEPAARSYFAQVLGAGASIGSLDASFIVPTSSRLNIRAETPAP